MNIQIYVNGTKIDLFKEESLVIEKSIKKSSKPDVIFTDLSRTITAPASKTNNRVFKYAHRTDLTDSVDIKQLVDAEIRLNDSTISKGFVNIESVSVKDGDVSHYALRYTGNLAQIKKSIKEDKLSSLDLSAHDYSWDLSTTVAKLSTSTNADIRIGLNSVKERIIKHSTDADYSETSGISTDSKPVVNVDYINNTWSKGYGLPYTSLRPSIKMSAVMSAIDSHYGLSFTGAMQDSKVTDLYMLLHRKSDKDSNANTLTETYDGFTATQHDELEASGSIINTHAEDGQLVYSIRIQGVGLTSVQLVDFDDRVVDSGQGNGDITISGTVTLDSSEFLGTAPYFQVIITGLQSNAYTVSGTLTQTWNDGGTLETRSISLSGSYTIQGLFKVNDNIPDIKVIDFISGLFKMFNIVVTDVVGTANGTGGTDYSISTSFYEDFINNGSLLMDITKYVDSSEVKIAPASEFSSVELKFAEPKTRLGKAFADANAREFGSVEYVPSDVNAQRLSGAPYKIEVPFQNIVGEPLSDLGNSSAVFDLSYVHICDSDGEEVATKPFLHYFTTEAYDVAISAQNVSPSSIQAAFSHGEITPYNSAENVLLSFNSEIDYATMTAVTGDDLFTNNYKKLIVDNFRTDRRKVILSAYLPKQFHLNFQLNSTVKYKDSEYLVDSVKTNYRTAKSELTLITK